MQIKKKNNILFYKSIVLILFLLVFKKSFKKLIKIKVIDRDTHRGRAQIYDRILNPLLT